MFDPGDQILFDPRADVVLSQEGGKNWGTRLKLNRGVSRLWILIFSSGSYWPQYTGTLKFLILGTTFFYQGADIVLSKAPA